MACHEVAALRLGLMNALGIEDEAERAHELAELGDQSTVPGPISALSQATSLADLKRYYRASLSTLTQNVASRTADDPKLPYLQTLLVLTKKVELELDAHLAQLERFYRNLEEVHDYVHEIYPSR